MAGAPGPGALSRPRRGCPRSLALGDRGDSGPQLAGRNRRPGRIGPAKCRSRHTRSGGWPISNPPKMSVCPRPGSPWTGLRPCGCGLALETWDRAAHVWRLATLTQPRQVHEQLPARPPNPPSRLADNYHPQAHTQVRNAAPHSQASARSILSNIRPVRTQHTLPLPSTFTASQSFQGYYLIPEVLRRLKTKALHANLACMRSRWQPATLGQPGDSLDAPSHQRKQAAQFPAQNLQTRREVMNSLHGL